VITEAKYQSFSLPFSFQQGKRALRNLKRRVEKYIEGKHGSKNI